MDHLMRQKAPITAEAWAEIDDEARRSLGELPGGQEAHRLLRPARLGPLRRRHRPARARRGPAGRRRPASGPGSCARWSRCAPRSPSPREELDASQPWRLRRRPRSPSSRRPGPPPRPRTSPSSTAWPAPASWASPRRTPHQKVMISDDYAAYPTHAADAIAMMREAGVEGPWAHRPRPALLRRGDAAERGGRVPGAEAPPAHPRGRTGRLRSRRSTAPWWSANAAATSSSCCGQDFAIGYLDHDADAVHLYLEETIAARICSPEAAVHLAYPGGLPSPTRASCPRGPWAVSWSVALARAFAHAPRIDMRQF